MANRVNNTAVMKMFKRFPDALTEELKTAVATGAETLRVEISANAPKATGELANDADAVVSKDGLSASVGYDSNAPGFKAEWKKHGFIAVFQEYGTKKMPAHPFVRPAYLFVLPKILAGIQAAVSNTLNRASNGDF